jgi:hypothetical protein
MTWDDDGWHTCHFCGTYVKDGLENDGTRHWLSDCRPDLVEHEPGPACTWPYRPGPNNCYAYKDEAHTTFYPDGPM